MKYTRWIILVAMVALSTALARPAVAGPMWTSCSGVIANTTISGDLIVPQEVYCELGNVTVFSYHNIPNTTHSGR